MPDFTSPWLETGKTPSYRTDSTDSQTETCLAVSAVSDTTRQKQPYQQTDAFDIQAEVSALIAELPPTDDWDLEATAARILAMNEAERGVYYAALIHDWRAWRLAMERFAESKGATA